MNPTRSAIETRLIETITRQQPDLVDFCRRLIQTPSVNGEHDEATLAEVIAGEARRLGLSVTITGDNPRRPNVIVSTSAAGDTGLLLIGHLDTVPAGDPSAWSHPPFAGEIADGRVYGRGAIDTKGGIAASIYALAALAQHPDALPNGRAQFIGVPDEETGATGTLGIKYLAARGLLAAQGAIYAYSGSDLILGHRGLVRYRVRCAGQAIHTGANEWQEGSAGANAVTGMARLLLALEGLTFPYSATRYFERFKTVITPGTVISGGVSINIVPDQCEALIDIRTTPEHSAEMLELQFMQLMAKTENERRGIKFSLEQMNHIPAALSDDSAPVFRVLAEGVKIVRGVTPTFAVAGPANEGYLLIAHGIPTVCGFGVIGANAHAVDEYVEVDSLAEAAHIFALTAHRLDITP